LYLAGLGAFFYASYDFANGYAAGLAHVPAVSLTAVALAYAALGPALFEKTPDGRINPVTRILLLPYLIAARLNARRWTRRDANPAEIAPGLFVGRFPRAREAACFASVIDLSAEFAQPGGIGSWQSFPMLDLAAPAPEILRQASAAIATAPRPTLVCCALGYGRSIAATAVWLVRSGHAPDLDAALALLRQRRPKLRLFAAQRAAIERALPGRAWPDPSRAAAPDHAAEAAGPCPRRANPADRVDLALMGASALPGACFLVRSKRPFPRPDLPFERQSRAGDVKCAALAAGPEQPGATRSARLRARAWRGLRGPTI
jgi:hypothetical protein